MDPEGNTAPEPELISQSDLRARLADKRVAIVGCGGLGSNCAVMLVRTGVLRLTLADFDVVEADNLNRQMFFLEHVGMSKVEALADVLRRINPHVDLVLYDGCVTEENIQGLVSGADVIIEAVDSVEAKALIANECSRDLPDVPVVLASGLAGHGSANLISTERLGDCMWVVGDMQSDIRDGHALVASRVTLAAAHQANAAVRLLLGFDGA